MNHQFKYLKYYKKKGKNFIQKKIWMIRTNSNQNVVSLMKMKKSKVSLVYFLIIIVFMNMIFYDPFKICSNQKS